MHPPPIPHDEPERLAALNALGLMYTPAEECYDRITRLAARSLKAPIAYVSLVDEKKQWFKSVHGLDARETPRDISFCGHTIVGDDTFVVEDTSKDERFADNPLVTRQPRLAFYAGQPVRAPNGSRVGTLCVGDTKPRRFNRRDSQTLRDLAAFVEAEFARNELSEHHRVLLTEADELRRKAMIDGLTRMWNHNAILELLKGEAARAARGVPLCVAMIDIDRFKRVNDDHGHQSGDRVLSATAAAIRAGSREYDAVGRYGGEEFLLVLGTCGMEPALAVCERIRERIASTPVTIPGGASLPVTVSLGLTAFGPGVDTPELLVAVADRALYRAKNNGRNRIEIG